MNEIQLEEVWRHILARKGFQVQQIKIGPYTYLRTNYKRVEPGTSKNINWLLDFRASINPTAISEISRLAAENKFDYVGIFLTSTVTTSSAGTALTFPNVKLYDVENLKSELAEYSDIQEKSDIQFIDIVPHDAETLLERLKRCPPGKENWKDYQNLVEDIFAYLFVPPLEKGVVQSRTEDGSEIRDITFPNRVESGLWKIVRDHYKGLYVVVDAKNRNPIGPGDVEKFKDYLGDQIGYFGILPTRSFSPEAEEARHKAFTKDKKMIVLLNDQDISNMITKKARNEKHEEVITHRLDAYHLKYAY